MYRHFSHSHRLVILYTVVRSTCTVHERIALKMFYAYAQFFLTTKTEKRWVVETNKNSISI